MPRKEIQRRNSMSNITTGLSLDKEMVDLNKSMINPVPVPDSLLQKKSVKKQESIPSASVLSDQEYYERMLLNSQNEDLVKKIKDSDAPLPEGTTKLSWMKADRRFVQKLPVAKKDHKGRNIESGDVATAKKTFRNADLCTSREYKAMKAYFKNWTNMEGPAIEGNNTAGDPKLMDFVNSIISVDFGVHMLTDDYLSEHMPELYELSRKLKMYDEELRDEYPDFFDNLPEETKSKLDMMAEMGADLKELLTQHMNLHGVHVDVGSEKNEGIVTLRKENEKKSIRHAEREQKQTAYEALLAEFEKNHIRNYEKRLAITLTEEDRYNAEETADALEERIRANEISDRACGNEMRLAVAEIKHTMQVRSELIEKQRGFLRELNTEKDKGKLRDLRRNIARTNRKIELTLKHADHYREFISFGLGEIPNVSKETAVFLQKENQEAMNVIIRFKAAGDCLEETIVASDRTFILDRISKLKEKGNDKNAKEQIALLEEQLANGLTYVKMPKEIFFERLTERQTIGVEKKKKYEARKSYMDKKFEDATKRAAIFAKENHLEKVQDRTSIGVKDPMDKMKDYDWMVIACQYKPTYKTPENVRRDMAEKGIRPLIKLVLSQTVQDAKDMADESKFDPDSEKYWENYTINQIGCDMKDLLDRINHNNIELSDEELVKLKAIGKITESVKSRYEQFERESLDPDYVLVKKDRRIMSNLDNFYQIFASDDQGVYPEADAAFARYSKDKLGFDYPANSSAVKQRMNTNNYLGTYVSAFYFYNQAVMNPAEYDKEYKKQLEKLQKELEDDKKKGIQAEVSAASKYGNPWGEDGAALKAKLKAVREETSKRVFAVEAFQKKIKEGEIKDDEFTALKLVLRPIQRDSLGTVKKESIKAYWQNHSDSEDYISGDEERKNGFLLRLGREMADFNVESLLDKDRFFDIKGNGFWETNDVLNRLIGFKRLYECNEGFFESNAFTELERNNIKRNIIYNPYINDLSDTREYFLRSYGANPNGTDYYADKKPGIVLFKMNEWVQRQTPKYMEEASLSFDRAERNMKANMEKSRKVYEEHGDAINRLASIGGYINSKFAEYAERKRQLGDDIKEAKKEKKDTKALQKKYDAAEDELMKLRYSKQSVSRIMIYIHNGCVESDIDTLFNYDVVFGAKNGFAEFFSEKRIAHAMTSVEGNEVFEKFEADYDTRDSDEQSRVEIKEVYERYENVFTGEEVGEWNDKLSSLGKIADIRSFKRMMEPVKRDVQGNLLPGYEHADKENHMAYEDFLSGEPERVQKVLYSMARKVLDLDLEFEKYDEEYVAEHAGEFYSKMVPFFAFSDFYTSYMDFFESDAFTEEERDKLRVLMKEGGYQEPMGLLMQYAGSLGLSEGKQIKSPAKERYSDEHEKWANNLRSESRNMVKKGSEKLKNAVAGARHVTGEKYLVMPDVLRGLARQSAIQRGLYREARIDSQRKQGKDKLASDMKVKEAKGLYELYDEVRDLIINPGRKKLKEKSKAMVTDLLYKARVNGIDITDEERDEAFNSTEALGKLLLKAAPEGDGTWINAETPHIDEVMEDEHFDSMEYHSATDKNVEPFFASNVRKYEEEPEEETETGSVEENEIRTETKAEEEITTESVTETEIEQQKEIEKKIEEEKEREARRQKEEQKRIEAEKQRELNRQKRLEREKEEKRKKEAEERKKHEETIEQIRNKMDSAKLSMPYIKDLILEKVKDKKTADDVYDQLVMYGTLTADEQALWLGENKDKQHWSEQEILEYRKIFVDHWGKTHDTKSLLGGAKETWEKKGQIPEFKQDKEGEALRIFTNFLADSAYTRKTHKKRPEQTAPYSYVLQHDEKKAQQGDRFRGYQYEVQNRGNDCWSVAGTALINFNLGKKAVGQKDMRAYKPKFRDRLPGEKKEDYNKAVQDIELFTTKNYPEKGLYSNQGNLFAISDYFAEKLGEGTAMKHGILNIDKCKGDDQKNPEKNAMHNITEVFRDKVREALAKQQPIAILRNHHYRVITGANEAGFTALNSSNPGSTDEFTYEEFLNHTDGVVELTWVEKPSTQEEYDSITKEYPGLTYTKGKGFVRSNKDEVADPDKVAIRNGVTSRLDTKTTGLSDVEDYYVEDIYLANKHK